MRFTRGPGGGEAGGAGGDAVNLHKRGRVGSAAFAVKLSPPSVRVQFARRMAHP